MANFNVICPKSYPNKCNLILSEKKLLEKPEKYKGFFMYQFKKNDPFLVETIKEYFQNPDYYIFDAKVEPGLVVKICKICQFALACDFGIACLSPENYNVFMEIGMILGLGKPCIMLYNKERLKCKNPAKLPFDISAFTHIEYSSKDSLFEKLKIEIPPFIEKLKTFTDADKDIQDYVMRNLKALPKESLILLKKFIVEGHHKKFRTGEFLDWAKEQNKKFGWDPDANYWGRLFDSFLVEKTVGLKTMVLVNEEHLDFLKQYLWSSDFDELLKQK